MIYEVMKYIHNFFPSGVYKTGTFIIKDGKISLNLSKGQYFLIEGSTFNDGVYQYPAEGLKDETFTGTVSALIPPIAFLQVVHEMEEYTKKNDMNSPYASESFGGYSYTKATDKNGQIYGVYDVFKKRLKIWKKV